MTQKAKEKKCPLCDGTGVVGGTKKLSPILREAHVKEAKRMRKEGYTLRQIAAALGHEHPQTIQNLLGNGK
jgi:hypothetical protein